MRNQRFLLRHPLLIPFLCLCIFVTVVNNSFAASPEIKWKFPLGSQDFLDLSATPAVGPDGTIYVPSGHKLLAIVNNGTYGTQKWSVDIGPPDIIGYESYIYTPSVDPNGNIYFSSQIKGVYGINKDGNPLWPPYSPKPWAQGEIAIGKNTIYASFGGGEVHAINTTTGQIKCETCISYQAGSVPAINSSGILYSVRESSLYALNDDLTIISPSFSGYIPAYNLPPVIGPNGEIYVLGANKLVGFKSDGTNVVDQDIGSYGGGHSHPVVGKDGTIYFSFSVLLDLSANIVAFTPDRVHDWGFNTSLFNRGNMLIGNDDNLYVFSNGMMLINAKTGNPIYDTNGNIVHFNNIFSVHPWSSPVMGSDGTIYVVGVELDNQGYLYAITTQSTGPASSSWPMLGANVQHTHVVNSPGLGVSPASFEFGDQEVSTCSTPLKYYTFSNTGNMDLNIENISLFDGQNFRLDLSPLVNPCAVLGTLIPSIAPGGFCNVGVQFCPKASGSMNDNIIVTSNDPNSPANIPMTGNGISGQPRLPFDSSISMDIRYRMCDANYPGDGEHKGDDFMVPANTAVYPVCDGIVVYNYTHTENIKKYRTEYDRYFNSLLVIKHNCNGSSFYGYYGHIRSDLIAGAGAASEVKVSDNLPIGYIREAYSYPNTRNAINDHLHLGINIGQKTYEKSQWGIAPRKITCADLIRGGWRDPITYFGW